MTKRSNFNFNFKVLTVTIVATVIACVDGSASTNLTTSHSMTAPLKNVNSSAMQDSSQYMTLTTTPASAVVEVVTLNTTTVVSKNETLKAQEQNQFPAGPFVGPYGPGGQIPPQLIAALQRRQQLLQAQNGGRPVNPLQLLQGFLPGGALANLTPIQRQQLQQLLRNQALQRQLAQRGGLQGLNVNRHNNNNNNNNNHGGGGDESNGGGGEEDGQGGGEGGGEGQEEPQQNPQDDPDLRQLQGLQGNNDNFPGDGGSIFEGLFPPGILSQQDIKDIEKGIDEQRRKEEEDKRQREEEEAAREQAANEEENNSNEQGDHNGNNGGNDQHQGHGHQQNQQQPQQPQPHPQQPYYPQPQQPAAYPPSQYPQNNLINPNLPPNNPIYPVQGGYPGQVAPHNPYQQPQQPQQPPGYAPGFAQIPTHPGGQVNHHQPPVAPVHPQQPNYLPGVQQIPGGLYPSSPVTPPPQSVHQQPVVPYSQGQLTPQHPQPQPAVPGYNPGTVGGYPAVNPINHQQQQQPQQPPQTGQLNPLNGLPPQINPAILNQINPALLQQYGQQFRNGGPFNPLAPGSPLAGQISPGQLNQLNQLVRQNQPASGQQQTPYSPFNPLTAYNGRSPVTPGRPSGVPASPNQPPPPPGSIGSLLRGAGRALGIPGFAAGSDTPTQGAPYTTESPVTRPDYGAIRNKLADRAPQSFDPSSRRPYDREDDRRTEYPERGTSAGVDYDGDRDGPNSRSPYREKYERTRGDRPVERFSSYGKVKDEVRRDRDYANDYRAGVEYNPNEVDDHDHTNHRHGDLPSRPRPSQVEDERNRGNTYPFRRTFRDEVGDQFHREYQGPRERGYDRSPSRFDDESDLGRNRANPFLVG